MAAFGDVLKEKNVWPTLKKEELNQLTIDQISETLVTSKALLYRLNITGSGIDLSSGNPDFHLLLETSTVKNIIFDFQRIIELVDDITSIDTFFFLFQKCGNKWAFDTYCDPCTLFTLTNIIFKLSSTVTITGSSHSFFEKWRTYPYKFMNGHFYLDIDNNCFKKIFSIHPHTPSLIWTIAPSINPITYHPKPKKPSPLEEDFIKLVLFNLNMQEVSALMGKAGHRINSIRLESNCLIKILPATTEVKMLPQRAIMQEVILSGPVECVQLAMEMIQAFLKEWRNTKTHYIG